MHASTRERQPDRITRAGAGRVVRWGVLGALPGLVVIGVTVLLHTADVLTADQSQIGFIGVPMLFVGSVIGLLAGAESSGLTRPVLGGIVIGVVAGALASAALVGLWTGFPFLVVVVPGAMVVGASLAALRATRG